MKQSSPRILLVGHCAPDNSYLRITLTSAAPGARVFFANDDDELRSALAAGVDLILLNRELDGLFDLSTGLEHIRALRQSHPEVKTMLVSNYADAQEKAVAAGALPGFGKCQLGTNQVVCVIRQALQPSEPERVR